MTKTIVLPETNNPRNNNINYPVVISIVDDVQMENPDEYFFVTLTSIGAGMQTDILTSNVTILEEGNDIGIHFVAESFFVYENVNFATITLTRKAKDPTPLSQLGEVSVMYKAVSDGISQNQNAANPDFVDQSTYNKIYFHDDFYVHRDGRQTLIGQKAEFKIKIFNDTVYDQNEMIILSIKNVIGATLQSFSGEPCPMIAGEFICTTTLTIKDDGDAGEIVFLDQIARTLQTTNSPPYTFYNYAGNVKSKGSSMLREDRSSLDGSLEEDILMIFNEPVNVGTSGGYVKNVQVKLKHGSIGSLEDLKDTANWPYIKNKLPKWHALVYERVNNSIPNIQHNGFRLIASRPIQPIATYDLQRIEINPPLRVEPGHYMGISIDKMNTCYGREINGKIKLCSDLQRNQDITTNQRKGGRLFNIIDMQGLSIATHGGTCCGSTSRVDDSETGQPQYAWVERSYWPKSCTSSSGSKIPCLCASQNNNNNDDRISLNWLRNDTERGIEIGSCSREGITSNHIDSQCNQQETSEAFQKCCTWENATSGLPKESHSPLSWCSGVWTISRSPKLEQFREVGLSSPQKCYTNNTDGNKSYSCHDYSNYCILDTTINGWNGETIQNYSITQCSNANALYDHPIEASSSSSHGSAAYSQSSWGSNVYFHTDDYIDEVLPIYMLNSKTWEKQSKNNIYEPKQYDVSFDIDVAPALVEGTSLDMSFGREGAGVSMNVIAYVKQQSIQSKIAQQIGGVEAKQGIDWDWKDNQDLIQIIENSKTATAPLTFDTGVNCPYALGGTGYYGKNISSGGPGTCEYPLLNDNIFEIQNETATLAIVDALFARVGVASSTFVTIKDDGDHGYIEFLHSSITVSEREANATVTLMRRRGIVGRCRILIISTDATAVESEDYVKFNENIYLEDGENSTKFNVTFTNDDDFEYPNEYFKLTITEAEVTVNGSSMYMRMDESTIPTISVYIVDDGDAGLIGFRNPQYVFPETGYNYTSEYQVQLVRTDLATNAGGPGSSIFVGDLAVEYTTVIKTAVDFPDRDFVPTSNTVYFYGGVQERTVSISIEDDDYFEYMNEYFDIEIVSVKYNNVNSNVIGYSNQRTKIEVMDDGDFGEINFVLQTDDSTGIRRTGGGIDWVLYNANEMNGTISTCTMTVSRTGRSTFDTDLRVRYKLIPTTADINDFTNSTSWIYFLAGGASTKTITVNILPDDVYEYPDEEIQVVLHNLQYRKDNGELWTSSPVI